MVKGLKNHYFISVIQPPWTGYVLYVILFCDSYMMVVTADLLFE